MFTLKIYIKIIIYLSDKRFQRYSSILTCTRLNIFFSHHLPHQTANETITFVCFSRLLPHIHIHIRVSLLRG